MRITSRRDNDRAIGVGIG